MRTIKVLTETLGERFVKGFEGSAYRVEEGVPEGATLTRVYVSGQYTYLDFNTDDYGISTEAKYSITRTQEEYLDELRGEVNEYAEENNRLHKAYADLLFVNEELKTALKVLMEVKEVDTNKVLVFDNLKFTGNPTPSIADVHRVMTQLNVQQHKAERMLTEGEVYVDSTVLLKAGGGYQ